MQVQIDDKNNVVMYMFHFQFWVLPSNHYAEYNRILMTRMFCPEI